MRDAFSNRNPFLEGPDTSPHASINRLPLTDLPGLPLEPGLRERTAFPELSGASLERATEGDWALSGAQAPRVRRELIRLGQLLGRVIAILKTAPEEARERPDWGEQEWAWWALVDEIFLAGGAFRAPVGNLLIDAAEDFLRQAVPDPPRLVLLPCPERAGLAGAATLAKIAHPDLASYLVCDWGQTKLKSAFVFPAPGGGSPGEDLWKPRPAETMPSPSWGAVDPAEEARQAARLHTFLLDFLIRALNDWGPATPGLSISIANYVHRGQLIDRGAYGKLRLLAPRYDLFLEDEIQRTTGRKLSVRLIHDGFAGAAGLPPPVANARRALILWGTALGVGFAHEPAERPDPVQERPERPRRSSV